MRALLLGLLGAAALAPSPPPRQLDPAALETGFSLYRTHCAVCHGKEAQGDGPLADQLRAAPPDLTRLSARNAGRFDAETVARVIDGRHPVKGHGGPEMPTWGDAFKERRDGYSEANVQARIAALVRYLESIQKK